MIFIVVIYLYTMYIYYIPFRRPSFRHASKFGTLSHCSNDSQPWIRGKFVYRQNPFVLCPEIARTSIRVDFSYLAILLVPCLGWLSDPSDPFQRLSDLQRSGMKRSRLESPGTKLYIRWPLSQNFPTPNKKKINMGQHSIECFSR